MINCIVLRPFSVAHSEVESAESILPGFGAESTKPDVQNECVDSGSRGCVTIQAINNRLC
jgi:hypothetical protein